MALYSEVGQKVCFVNAYYQGVFIARIQSSLLLSLVNYGCVFKAAPGNAIGSHKYILHKGRGCRSTWMFTIMNGTLPNQRFCNMTLKNKPEHQPIDAPKNS